MSFVYFVLLLNIQQCCAFNSYQNSSLFRVIGVHWEPEESEHQQLHPTFALPPQQPVHRGRAPQSLAALRSCVPLLYPFCYSQESTSKNSTITNVSWKLLRNTIAHLNGSDECPSALNYRSPKHWHSFKVNLLCFSVFQKKKSLKQRYSIHSL